MIRPVHELDSFLKVFPKAKVFEEGVIAYIHLPSLQFALNGQTVVTEGLLCPQTHPSAGYETRLFFDRSLAPVGANWSDHTILNRRWFARSFNGVSADQPLVAILANHLDFTK